MFLHCAELDSDGYPPECPFSSRRAGRVRETLLQMGLLSGDNRLEAPPVPLTEQELLRFHTREYIDALKAAQDGRHSLRALEMGLGTGDCPVFPHMYDFVRLAGGGSLTGARMILRGEASVVFNPSGGFHHARADAASGFCYINDVVIAALEIAEAGRRLAVVDFDAHHGDGQQAAFYERGDILNVSIHESGRTLFPHTGFETEIGRGEGLGTNINIPLPMGTYDSIYDFAFRSVAMPVLRAWKPDVVMLELGMDALSGDPLAHLNLTNNVLADLVELVCGLGAPVLALGGGGYNIANTVRSWALCWSVLCGEHSNQHDMSVGLGGVMLENTDWMGGLRDRVLHADHANRAEISAEIQRVVRYLKDTVFPLHGLA